MIRGINLKDILQIRSDNLFHDLVNKENMDFVEFTVMQILDYNYEKINNKCLIFKNKLDKL